MILGVTIPDRGIYVLKHFSGERALAAASVIRCSLHALPVPAIYVSPDRDTRTSKRLSYCLRRNTLERNNHRVEHLTRIRLLSMRCKLRHLINFESVRIRNSRS